MSQRQKAGKQKQKNWRKQKEKKTLHLNKQQNKTKKLLKYFTVVQAEVVAGALKEAVVVR